MVRKSDAGTRQVHLRVPTAIHRRLRVKAAIDDKTINQLLAARVISMVLDETGGGLETGNRR